MASSQATTMSKNSKIFRPAFDNGYDSEGSIGHFYAIDHEVDVEEPALGEAPPEEHSNYQPSSGGSRLRGLLGI